MEVFAPVLNTNGLTKILLIIKRWANQNIKAHNAYLTSGMQ